MTHAGTPAGGKDLTSPSVGVSDASAQFLAKHEGFVKGIVGSCLYIPEKVTFGVKNHSGGFICGIETVQEKQKALKAGYEHLVAKIGLSFSIEGEIIDLNLESGRFEYRDPEGNRHVEDLTQSLLSLPQKEQDAIRDQATEVLHFQAGKDLGKKALIKGSKAQFNVKTTDTFQGYSPLIARLFESLHGKPLAEQVDAMVEYFELGDLSDEKRTAVIEDLDLVQKTNLMKAGTFNPGVILALLGVNPDKMETKLKEASEASVPTFRLGSTKKMLRAKGIVEIHRFIAECKGYSMDAGLRAEFIEFFAKERLPFPYTVDLEILFSKNVVGGFTPDEVLREHIKGFDHGDRDLEKFFELFGSVRGPAYRTGLHAILCQDELRTLENLKFVEKSLLGMKQDDKKHLFQWCGIQESVIDDQVEKMSEAQKVALAKTILGKKRALADLSYADIRSLLAESLGMRIAPKKQKAVAVEPKVAVEPPVAENVEDPEAGSSQPKTHEVSRPISREGARAKTAVEVEQGDDEIQEVRDDASSVSDDSDLEDDALSMGTVEVGPEEIEEAEELEEVDDFPVVDRNSTEEEIRQILGHLDNLAKDLFRSTVTKYQDIVQDVSFDIEEKWIQEFKKQTRLKEISFDDFTKAKFSEWNQAATFVNIHLADTNISDAEFNTIMQEFYLADKVNFSRNYPAAYERLNFEVLAKLGSYQAAVARVSPAVENEVEALSPLQNAFARVVRELNLEQIVHKEPYKARLQNILKHYGRGHIGVFEALPVETNEEALAESRVHEILQNLKYAKNQLDKPRHAGTVQEEGHEL